MDPDEQALRQAFAQWLRTAMEQRGVSAADLGHRLGRANDWLGGFELGLRGADLRWEEARGLIVFLGGSPEEVRSRLLRGERFGS